jgi:hypothetical protein
MTSETKHPDSEIIDRLGGTMAVTRLCEVKSASVSKWRITGIPRARKMYLRLIRPDAFEPAPKQRKKRVQETANV